jgi:hypothetical protein
VGEASSPKEREANQSCFQSVSFRSSSNKRKGSESKIKSEKDFSSAFYAIFFFFRRVKKKVIVKNSDPDTVVTFPQWCGN